MTQINLLHTDTGEHSRAAAYAVLNAIGIGLLVLVLAAGIFFYFSNRSMQSKVAQESQSQASAKSSLETNKNYKGLVATQQKLKDLQVVLAQHTDWSDLVTQFAAATLKSTSFSDGATTGSIYHSFRAASDGTVEISGTVGSFADLDRLIKGFELADFNSYITNVSLTSVGTAEEKKGVTFTIDVSFNKDILSALANANSQASASASAQAAAAQSPSSQPVSAQQGAAQ